MNKTIRFGMAAALLVALPASAHHSFAMFDNAKEQTLEGTVKEFQWTNPHAWVQLMVKDAQGTLVEWSIECASPNGLRRQGVESQHSQARRQDQCGDSSAQEW